MKLPDSITSDFTEILSPSDLALYISICALISCSRNELKETILKSNNYATLMESSAEASVIIEHFLNGNYLQFQKCLAQIQKQLKFDLFFGEQKTQIVFRDIRLKAL